MSTPTLYQAFKDICAFQDKFQKKAPHRLTRLTGDQLEFRKRIIREEAEELCEALDNGDFTAIAAETMDLVYTGLGACVESGLPDVDLYWQAVQRANMQKEYTGPGQKPRKPAGWVSPRVEIASIIERRAKKLAELNDLIRRKR